MTENGMFRVSFRGFNKQDVLSYIDETQTAAVMRLNDSETFRTQAEESARVNEARAIEAEEKLAAMEAEVQPLREQVEKLTALAKMYKRELLELREQAEQNAAKAEDSTELAAANARIHELENENALLAEQNARYLAVVGDMSSLVMEARVLSASYFENAHQKSVDCIKRLDTFLDDLKMQAEQTRFMADIQKQTGEEQIETLLSDLKKRSEGAVPAKR